MVRLHCNRYNGCTNTKSECDHLSLISKFWFLSPKIQFTNKMTRTSQVHVIRFIYVFQNCWSCMKITTFLDFCLCVQFFHSFACFDKSFQKRYYCNGGREMVEMIDSGRF